jgi:hypothetical protein
MLRLALLLILPLTLWATPAQAGLLNERPIWVGVGFSGGGALTTPVETFGTGYGHLHLSLRLLPVAPEVILREGIAGKRGGLPFHHGGLAAGVRILLPKFLVLRPSLRVAFSHEHRTTWAHLKTEPIKVIFGVAEGIEHRSGAETGFGLELQLDPKGHVHLALDGTAQFLFADDGWDPGTFTGLWEIGVRFALGPKL